MLISYLALIKQANAVSGNFHKVSPHSGTHSRYRVEVRLTPQERSQLEALAHSAGMTLSRYVRYACFHDASLPIVTDIAIDTYQALGKIGDILAQMQCEIDSETLRELLSVLHQVRAEIAGVRSTESGLQYQSTLKITDNP
ncbi:hypothetical protein IQ250_09365 [Pseudanabaenaceae cyanobacterium LEGE 13415]|nr:hypothetical protein [Pseudanabaenaceae cyanobacterium LEGE 13415]